MPPEFVVERSEVFKQGTGKNGKPYTIYKLTLQGSTEQPTGFEFVNPGDRVTLEASSTTGTDGKVYQNLNYKKVGAPPAAAQAPAPAPAPAYAAPQQPAPAAAPATAPQDKRILALLTIMAEQMGIPKETILDVLEGRNQGAPS